MGVTHVHYGRSPEYNQQVRQAIDNKRQKLAEYKDASRKWSKAGLAKARQELQTAERETRDVVARSPKTKMDNLNPGGRRLPAFSAEVGKELMRQYEASRQQPLGPTREDYQLPEGEVERNKRIADKKIAAAVRKTYPSFGNQEEAGQPLEATMVGTNNNAAPTSSNQYPEPIGPERPGKTATQAGPMTREERLRRRREAVRQQSLEKDKQWWKNIWYTINPKNILSAPPPFASAGYAHSIDPDPDEERIEAKDVVGRTAAFNQTEEEHNEARKAAGLEPVPTKAERISTLRGETKPQPQSQGQKPLTEAEVREQVLEEMANGTTFLPRQDGNAQEPSAEVKDILTVSPKAIEPSREDVENALTDEVEKAIITAPPSAGSAVVSGNAVATARPPVATSNYAVPTAEERQAWANKQYTDATLMSQALEDAANATDDPKQKALYMMAAERAKEWEGWQDEENAYRRGQAQAAREMRDRLRSAAQRRDQREYNDQDPSWADTMRKVPLVQNTIGVRRYNPETGEMEWHYPRNAAEGVGALLTNLPMIGHAILTGNNGLQREYRAMEQNQMFAPYKMDYADMEDYRRGAMTQPTPTWSDKMAEGIGEGSFAGIKEQQRLQGIEATAEYIRAKYGDEMANAYIKAGLGIKSDETVLTGKQIDQLIATADYLSTYPNANPEQFALLEGRLLDAIGQHADPTDPYNARIQAALDKMSARRTRTVFETSKKRAGEEFDPATADEVASILRNRGTFDMPLLQELPVNAQQELVNIAREYQNKLATDGAKAAEEFVRERIQNSAVFGAIGWDSEDVINALYRYIGGALPEGIYRKYLDWTGRSGEARDRKRRGEDVMLPNYRTPQARRATTEDELVRLIGEDGGNSIINSLQQSISEANARKAEAIRREMNNEMNQVNTTVY